MTNLFVNQNLTKISKSSYSHVGCVITSLGPDENKTDKYVNEIDLYLFGYAMAQGKVFQQREGLVVSIGFHYGSNFAGKVLCHFCVKKLTHLAYTKSFLLIVFLCICRSSS